MESTRRSWLRGLLVTPLALLASKLTLKAAQQLATHDVIVRVNGKELTRVPVFVDSTWNHYEIEMISKATKSGLGLGVSVKDKGKNQYTDDITVRHVIPDAPKSLFNLGTGLKSELSDIR